MRKIGVCSYVAGIAVVCIVFIGHLKSIKTKGGNADTVNPKFEEEFNGFVEQTEIESNNNETEMEQSIEMSQDYYWEFGKAKIFFPQFLMYLMSEDYYWELEKAAWEFVKLAEDYVIYEYKYQGAMPQTEIIVLKDFESREDVPQTVIVVSEETIDYASMSRAVCAIEDFCGTDFCIVDTYYVGLGGNVQFEYDNHEYTCITEGISGEMKICDKVFEVSPTSIHKVPYIPSEIKICD